MVKWKTRGGQTILEKSQSSAFLVIYDGVVLVSWGEVDRRFLIHSARKSLDNVMYGVAIDQGLIDLNATLGDLNITELSLLTSQERQATVKDLIKSRSGVYLPSAYSLNENLPIRGSSKPGEKWYYNNWDFNVNESILEQQTREPIEEFFENNLAKPLNLQDFRLMDVYDHKEVRSQHPAHPFRMSARDLARIGLLYLNNGKWKKHQVISQNWIKESTKPHSKLDKEKVDSIATQFIGTYEAPWDYDPDVENISIIVQYRNDGLIADIEYGGTYKMLKVSDNKFMMEDMDTKEDLMFPMDFFIDEKGNPSFSLKLAFVLEEVVFKKI